MAVGQEIVCLCTTCKLELRHVIVAHKSGNSGPVAKVRCNTCGKIHAYRSTPQEKSGGVIQAKREVKPRAKVQVIPLEVEWREQLKSREGAPSLPYAPFKDFKVGDVIDHPTFGCGVVRALKDGNKFEILFQRDVKVLMHRLKEE
jgi:hypothetical protein